MPYPSPAPPVKQGTIISLLNRSDKLQHLFCFTIFLTLAFYMQVHKGSQRLKNKLFQKPMSLVYSFCLCLLQYNDQSNQAAMRRHSSAH